GLLHDPVAWLLLRGLAGIVSAWSFVFGSAYVLQRLALIGRQRLSGLVFGGGGFGPALILAAACWPGYQGATQSSAPATVAGAGSLRLGKHMRVVICYGILGFGY